MPLRIFSNLSSQFAQRALAFNNQRLSDEIKVIGSGDRIQKAGDDAASLAISEGLRSDARVLRQASRNGNDAMAMVNTADNSVNEISTILIRLRELAARASTGTLTGDNRQAIQLEVDQLLDEINRISNASEFNGKKLLDGSFSASASSPVLIHIGLDSSASNQINLNQSMDIARLDSQSLGIDDISITTRSGAVDAVEELSQTIKDLTAIRTRIGSLQEQLGHAINNLNANVENLVRADSNYRDADIGSRMAELTKNQILVQASTAMVGQANLNPQSALQLLQQ